MPNQFIRQFLGPWVRALGAPEGKPLQRELHNDLDAAHVHSNEIRLIQKLVRERQQRIENTNTPSEEQSLLVTDAVWQNFLSRWQAAEKSLFNKSNSPPELASQAEVIKIGGISRWAANQRWFAVAAGICTLMIGLQLTHYLRPVEDDVVMRGDEQAQRMVVASSAEAKAKADEMEKLLRESGVLVRRIEISAGARIEAKLTANDLKQQIGLRVKLKQLGVTVPQHGRVVVEWVRK